MFKILRMVSLVFGMKYHTHLHQQTDVSWRYTLGLQRPCQPQSFDRHSEPHIALWNGPSIMRIIAQAFASIAAMCLVGTVARVTQSDSEHDPFSFDQLGILGRDVAIIGCGSAGTYAAIRLQRLGKSFVVTEKQDKLRGHSNTYSYTATGIPVPYSVMSFLNKDVVTDYFSHLRISLVNKTTVTNQSENVDFATGEPIAIKLITIPSDDPEVRIAIENYKAQLARHVKNVLS